MGLGARAEAEESAGKGSREAEKGFEGTIGRVAAVAGPRASNKRPKNGKIPGFSSRRWTNLEKEGCP
ncbi:hypothetical protein RUM43_001364 [Polyplax serrata]|uniref:Uncharacterized protein n=1 Tax=Polyplax serrata TaxID=468196 RepID=A0AAN8SDQ9_POLSC